MKIKFKGKRRTALRVVACIVLPIVFLCALICNSFIPRSFADFYGAKIFPYLTIPLQSLNMFFQNSMTENIVVCLAPIAIAGLIVWLVFLIKKMLTKGAAEYFYKAFRNVMIIGIVAAVMFQLFHGFNYKRTNIATELKLTGKELTYEDYVGALNWAYMGMIEARSHLGEDYNGVAHMSTSFENSATHACSLLDAYSEKYGIPLSDNYVRPKPVSMSHYWSYTHIVGVYDMFLCEANINTDYMSVTDFPITICHELCHAKGYASETDCNLLATLACCSSSRADFRYAGFHEIFWNLYYVTGYIAKAENKVMPQYAVTLEMEPIYRDDRASELYWRQIDEEVENIRKVLGIDITETSTNVNDAFLKGNGEDSGVDSYVVPDSIYVRYFLTHMAGEKDV